jgi:hypothetical protein
MMDEGFAIAVDKLSKKMKSRKVCMPIKPCPLAQTKHNRSATRGS